MPSDEDIDVFLDEIRAERKSVGTWDTIDDEIFLGVSEILHSGDENAIRLLNRSLRIMTRAAQLPKGSTYRFVKDRIGLPIAIILDGGRPSASRRKISKPSNP